MGIGATAPAFPLTVVGDSNTYIPLSVQSSSTFGTWLNLTNTSSGGKTWSFVSTASANSEGIGDLALYDGDATKTVYIHANLHVDGTVSKGGGSFEIDDPLDPANKTLSHSFVESPDMMNIYNGNAVLDENGEAEIRLPGWFEALNRDFRYQLTCIGGFAPVYVAKKISNNQFKIAGGKTGLEISWQVTGIRQDAWANAHRISVEEEKPDGERGLYLHPDLYGQPPAKAIGYIPPSAKAQ